jgi:dolichyl-phosphate-mannose-protein mannosyltransferase
MQYVPAARQMLEPVLPSQPLNPDASAAGERVDGGIDSGFGDVPLGWRYPSVLFGSLAIVAMYLCGLALFTAQGPAVASASIAFFNQMVFVQSRIAVLDISAPTLCLSD